MPPKQVACQDKPGLITTLVRALYTYFERNDIATAPPTLQAVQQLQNSLWPIASFLLGFRELQARRLLSETARQRTRYTRVTPLLTALLDIAHLRESCTLEDDAKLTTYLLGTHHQDLLEETMWHAWTTYGPLRKRGSFSQMARYHATATILIHFRLEHQQVSTVAFRLKKARQRRT
jgi:hypothetical protein